MQSLKSYIQFINSDLYIAGQLLPEEVQTLSETGVKSFLCLRGTQETGFRPDEKVQIEAKGTVYRRYPVSAESLNYESITHILREIDRLPKPILIGCRSAFRAGFIALLYLSTRGQLTLGEAQSLKQRLGFDFSPKPSFQQWFERYLSQYSAG